MIPRRHLLVVALACLAIALLGVWSLAAYGEEQDQKTFGTAVTSHTVSGVMFTGFEGTFGDYVLDSNENGGRACAVPGCWMIAPVVLPAGASIKSIEAFLCPPNTASDGRIKLLQSPLTAAPVVLATVSAAGLSGCQFVSATISPAHTVNNLANTYNLKYESTTDQPPLRVWIQQVRVYYALQVSPPPAVASFADVPTSHIFFQFIEALAKSGITGGCAAGFYCPDANVTRGQMAAFLSKALGLHFAP